MHYLVQDKKGSKGGNDNNMDNEFRSPLVDGSVDKWIDQQIARKSSTFRWVFPLPLSIRPSEFGFLTTLKWLVVWLHPQKAIKSHIFQEIFIIIESRRAIRPRACQGWVRPWWNRLPVQGLLASVCVCTWLWSLLCACFVCWILIIEYFAFCCFDFWPSTTKILNYVCLHVETKQVSSVLSTEHPDMGSRWACVTYSFIFFSFCHKNRGVFLMKESKSDFSFSWIWKLRLDKWIDRQVDSAIHAHQHRHRSHNDDDGDDDGDVWLQNAMENRPAPPPTCEWTCETIFCHFIISLRPHSYCSLARDLTDWNSESNDENDPTVNESLSRDFAKGIFYSSAKTNKKEFGDRESGNAQQAVSSSSDVDQRQHRKFKRRKSSSRPAGVQVLLQMDESGEDNKYCWKFTLTVTVTF
jgi:hypothetical protein